MVYDLILIFKNRIIISIILANVLSHALKLVFEYYKTRKFEISHFFRSGGMPSAHSASVMALTTGVYLTEGVTNLFIAVLFFSLLVLYDARGVRYEASKHAKLLNLLMEKGKFKMPKLKEIIGHDVTETAVGAVFGVVVALAVFFFI